MTVTVPYKPRPTQKVLHAGLEQHRFSAAVCHRRFGKTVLAINHLIKKAVTLTRERPRFHYIAPTYRMGKSAAWDYIQHYSRAIPRAEFNQSELRADYPNGGQLRILGADNPDAMRGIYSDGLVLDEYGMMAPNVFTEVLRPALSDREGWAFFIGTPNGKNQFYDVVQQAQREAAWFFAEFKASQTGIIPAAELQSARDVMTQDEYDQEYECSFEAAVKGAIYADQLMAARNSGRIQRIPVEPVLPVDTNWDLGVGDATAIWFTQSLRSGEVRVIDYYEASGEGLPHYIGVLKSKGYVYGDHWAPQDIQVREFASGRSRMETALTLGIKFSMVPDVGLEDGIHAARLFMGQCWFDAVRCEKGLEALQHYRWDYNSRLQEYKAVPVHDWACFTPDTKVLTRHGRCQIMDLPENGEVLTPCGWSTYQGPRVTRRDARLVAVTLSDGSTVRCTPDHLWLTESGWTCAEHLQPATPIQSYWTHSPNTLTAGYIGCGLESGITPEVDADCIKRCGVRRMGRFLRDVISTIVTRMRPTIEQITWNVCRPMSTWPVGVMACDGNSQRGLVSLGSFFRVREPLRPHGMGLRLGDSGTVGWRSGRNRGRSGHANRERVTSAGRWWRWWLAGLGISRNTVQRRVKPLHIVSVMGLDETADVWCIHVPDVECFALANGAIVHNSHGADSFRYLAVRHETPTVEKALDMRVPVAHWSAY